MNAVKKHIKAYNDFINICEAKMMECPAVFPVTHKFCNGMYRREMFIPKGGCLTSLIHLEEHFFEVVSGDIVIATQNGATRFIAPADGISPKGARKMGLALEDTLIVTYHPVSDGCTDVDILEERLFKRFNNPLLKANKMEVLK